MNALDGILGGQPFILQWKYFVPFPEFDRVLEERYPFPGLLEGRTETGETGALNGLSDE